MQGKYPPIAAKGERWNVIACVEISSVMKYCNVWCESWIVNSNVICSLSAFIDLRDYFKIGCNAFLSKSQRVIFLSDMMELFEQCCTLMWEMIANIGCLDIRVILSHITYSYYLFIFSEDWMRILNDCLRGLRWNILCQLLLINDT